MSELFGKRKSKVSRSDVKQSIIKANDRLREANDRIKLDIKKKKGDLKTLTSEYKQYKKSLDEIKDLQMYAKNELDAQQYEISRAEHSSKEAMDSLIQLSEEEALLQNSIKNLSQEEKILSGSVTLLKEKQLIITEVNTKLSSVRKEKRSNEKSLKLANTELDHLKADIESYHSRKSAAKREFDTFKGEIEREKRIAEERLKEVTDLTLRIDDDNKSQLAGIDQNIADRLSEINDMEELMLKKNYDFIKLQSKIAALEDQIKDAEENIEYSVNKEKEVVADVKKDFKKWKIEALDSIARLQLKGKIENIDKAGLKDILNG